MHEWIPGLIGNRLKEGFRLFGSVMKGYITNEAVILGVESRTSSPVRIPRDPVTREHTVISGLYPCGEGSGYSGGIVSSAVDGIKTAEAIAEKQENKRYENGFHFNASGSSPCKFRENNGCRHSDIK